MDQVLNPLVREALGSIFRKGLTVAATYLVTKGIWTGAEAETYVGAAALFLVSLCWGLWQQYAKRLKIVTALAMPQGSSEREVEGVIKAGLAPPATVPKQDCPYLPASAKNLRLPDELPPPGGSHAA